MIAYLFWHAAPDGAAIAEYEKTVVRFGGALADARIPGLLGNASYAIGRTPWLGEPGYEDWAWLEGSWALDALNERAVTGAMKAPHDAVAQATKHGGFGAVYYLVAGEHRILADSKVLWLSRPRGIAWRDIMPAITESAGAQVAVWRRQMVLGPAAEFALIGPLGFSVTVPQGWSALEVERRRLVPR